MAPLSPVPGRARRRLVPRLRSLRRPVVSLLTLIAGVPARSEPMSPSTPAPASVPAPAPGTSPSPSPTSLLRVVERSIVQDQGSWQVDYRLRNDGPTVMVGSPEEIQAKLEGWVSNSRVARHAVPRLSSLVVAGSASSPPWSAVGDLIASSDEAQRCRERVTLQVWPGDEPERASAFRIEAERDPGRRHEHEREREPERLPLLTLAPGAIVRVRLRLEHQHFLYGDYDPLLSQRQVELHLGAATMRDVLPMDREQYLALPKVAWPTPPEDRRDTRHFISAPDSLHLEAHIPGNEHYRFTERPVRYATKMRLRFWYLIASGTEGECRVRITQSKETPTAYKILYDAVQEECLPRVGRWVKVERVFRTEPEATSLSLDFRICDPDDTRIGELWIDDVSLEPVRAEPAGP